MCLLFESIAVINGKPQNLIWHQNRMNESRKSIFAVSDNISLVDTPFNIPKKSGLVKLRIVYTQAIENISYEKYIPKNPQTFQLIKSSLEYSHKYLDRSELNYLLKKRNGADEIIIVKDQLITDSSIGNLLFMAAGKWHTPSSPLLPGTMRAKLLESGKIKEKEISAKTLGDYEKVMVINAMNPFNIQRARPISSIRS